MHTVYVLKDVEYQHILCGAKPETYADTLQVVCALKAGVAAQHSVTHQEQFSAALEQVTFAIHNMVAMVAVLFVTMVQEQDHAVLKHMAETSIRKADLVALHSLPAILTVLVQHIIMWQFLQDYLPAMAA